MIHQPASSVQKIRIKSTVEGLKERYIGNSAWTIAISSSVPMS